jgi:hypothetical protein
MEFGNMAKKTVKETAAKADDWAATLPQPMAFTESDIARRAYDYYLARGREDGHAFEDWLRAESELKAAKTSGVA